MNTQLKRYVGIMTFITVFFAGLSGCNLLGKKDSGSTATGGDTGGATGGGSPPAPGLNCSSGSNGWDKVAGDTLDTTHEAPSPYFIVTSMSGLTGSTINSVKVTLHYTDASDMEGNASPIAASVTMDAYQCVSPLGPLGSSVATATMGNSAVKNYSNQETFSFGGGLTIPTNCPAGAYPLVFKLNLPAGHYFWTSTSYVSAGSRCYLPFSANGYNTATRSYAALIDANP